MELMRDELEEQKNIGFSQGKEEHLLEQIQKKLLKGKTLAQIAEELEETESTIKPLYDQFFR